MTEPPTCSDAKDCEVKWGAARNWILDHAGTKIQTYSADFIETYNPNRYSPLLAVAATKEPLADGSYKIVARMWCDNFIGCQPNQYVALNEFYNFVSEAHLSAR